MIIRQELPQTLLEFVYVWTISAFAKILKVITYIAGKKNVQVIHEAGRMIQHLEEG